MADDRNPIDGLDGDPHELVAADVAAEERAKVVELRRHRKADPDDEIQILGADTPSLTNPSIFQHVGHIGAYLGGISARFLADKQILQDVLSKKL